MKFKAFYERQEWKELRYRILRQYGFKCMACDRKRGEGVVLHVDHIQPISIYPELALTESNLQVLCADCNLGKSNKYTDDLRPRPHPVDDISPEAMRILELREILRAAEKHKDFKGAKDLKEKIDFLEEISKGRTKA